jgi:Domain of Unknown Function with PDB structure (DUF3858)
VLTVKAPARIALLLSFVFLTISVFATVARATDWDPVTDEEKAVKTDPLDPGAGAVALFKRGVVEIEERGRLNWITHIRTYTRIKILTESGRSAADISLVADKAYQTASFGGKTIMPSGQVDSIDMLNGVSRVADISFVGGKAYRVASVEGRTILPSGQIVPLDSSQVHRGVVYENGRHFAVMKTSFAMPAVEPGAIIEYQTEEVFDLFFVDSWIFDTEGLSTLRSSLRVTTGDRVRLGNLPLDTAANKITYKQTTVQLGTGLANQVDYEVSNLRALRPELDSPPFYDRAVRLFLAPRSIAISGETLPVIGRWDDVAQYVAKWQKDFAKSSKAAAGKARELTNKVADERERAEAIYNFIQQNVSSSGVLGVGTSRKADEVLNSKRADPDEMALLYLTMVGAAKLKADMVLLSPRDWQTMIPTFPSFGQLGRSIVRVNLQSGPVLVDPAAGAAPFGELPWWEQGVTAMVVQDNRMDPLTVPSTEATDNQFSDKLTSEIHGDWTIQTDEEITFRGAQAIDFRGDLLKETPETLDKRLADYLSFGLPESGASGIVHPDLRDTSQAFVFKARLQHKMDAAGSGQRLLNPWIADPYRTPVFTTARRSPVMFDYPQQRSSESVWKLPEGIEVDHLPQDVKVDSDLGSFSRACTQQAATVTCVRTLQINKTTLSTTAEYLDAKKFFEEVAQHDRDVIALREQ